MRKILSDTACWHCKTIDTVNLKIVDYPNRKINLDKWILLEDNGEQYQTGIHKHLVDMYRDYNLKNKPLLGYKLLYKTKEFNVFSRNSNESFYYNPYDSIKEMQQSLLKYVDKEVNEAIKQIKLTSKEIV